MTPGSCQTQVGLPMLECHWNAIRSAVAAHAGHPLFDTHHLRSACPHRCPRLNPSRRRLFQQQLQVASFDKRWHTLWPQPVPCRTSPQSAAACDRNRGKGDDGGQACRPPQSTSRTPHTDAPTPSPSPAPSRQTCGVRYHCSPSRRPQRVAPTEPPALPSCAGVAA
eukprot:scaffold38892_cov32-Tisochrysis_lutea.AAC.3